MRIGGIRIRHGEVTVDGRALFDRRNRDITGHGLVIGAGDRYGDRLYDTGVVRGTGVIGRGIGESHIAGLAIGEILEVSTWIEGKAAVVVVDDTAF